MIQIDDKIISFDIFEKKFCCDLPKCLGGCCVHGVSGAPLEADEVEALKKQIHLIEPYLKPTGRKAIKKQGVAVTDLDGDIVTPLIDGEECAFTVEIDNITYCAIEKAWLDGKVKFQKPISCHLYPIRVKNYKTFTALNYDKWSICEPARELGEKLDLPVYKFLKDVFIRAYGADFYSKLEEAAKLLEKTKTETKD